MTEWITLGCYVLLAGLNGALFALTRLEMARCKAVLASAKVDHQNAKDLQALTAIQCEELKAHLASIKRAHGEPVTNERTH